MEQEDTPRNDYEVLFQFHDPGYSGELDFSKHLPKPSPLYE